jgi:hypothetical protein
MWGVLVAPYILPTTPVGSSSTALGPALREVVSSSAWPGLTWPWVPGAEEMIVSHVTSWPVASFCSACMLPVS